jgi:hypothetical protein
VQKVVTLLTALVNTDNITTNSYNLYMIKLLLTLLIVTIISGFVIFYYFQMETKDQAKQEEIESLLVADKSYRITKYPENAKAGGSIELNWVFDPKILYYGHIIEFCLAGYDTDGNVINTIENDESICFYMGEGHNYYHHIGETLIQNETVSLKIPENVKALYESEPTYFAVKSIFVDQRKEDNMSEWAGTIAKSDTGPILIN